MAYETQRRSVEKFLYFDRNKVEFSFALLFKSSKPHHHDPCRNLETMKLNFILKNLIRGMNKTTHFCASKRPKIFSIIYIFKIVKCSKILYC